MAISATSLFSSGATSAATASATQTRAAAAAAVRKNREYAAISSLSQLGKTLVKAKFDTTSVAGLISYEDNYVDVPTYKRVVSYKTQTNYEDRPIYESRDVTGKKTIFKTVDVHGTRPTYETHDVFSDVPVYEQRDVLGTVVAGDKAASGFSDLASAGIDENGDFSLKVGDDEAATIKFGANNRISVTVGSTVTNFDSDGSPGAMSGALLNALNSVSGLAASYDAEGKLKLETADQAPLSIAEIDNEPGDNSGSPLAALGLSAGTTQASVIGTEQVQTGTEHVKTGEQQVQNGTEDYISGTKKVANGTRTVVTGTEQVQIGTQKVAVGTEQVIDTIRYDKTGTTRKAAGTIAVQGDRTTETTLSQASHKLILTAAMNLDSAIGPAVMSDGSPNPMAGIRGYVNVAKLKTSLNQTDIGLATLGVQQVLKAYQASKAAASSGKTA